MFPSSWQALAEVRAEGEPPRKPYFVEVRDCGGQLFRFPNWNPALFTIGHLRALLHYKLKSDPERHSGDISLYSIRLSGVKEPQIKPDPVDRPKPDPSQVCLKCNPPKETKPHRTTTTNTTNITINIFLSL